MLIHTCTCYGGLWQQLNNSCRGVTSSWRQHFYTSWPTRQKWPDKAMVQVVHQGSICLGLVLNAHQQVIFWSPPIEHAIWPPPHVRKSWNMFEMLGRINSFSCILTVRTCLRCQPLTHSQCIRWWSHSHPSKRFLLLREITGAFQLNSQVAKWDPDQSLQCEWCGHAEDSRVHRLFECDAFSHIRDKHAAVLDALEPYREDFALLPVVSVHPHHEFHDMLLHSIPPALLPNEARQRVLDFHPDRPITCYTDGSCAHQSCTLTRCAAFRIVLDLATNDAERRHHARNFLGNREAPPVLQRLVCGRLQGVQSIHRAELAAIIWITQTFPSHGLVAYTDGAWVIDVWTKCLLPNSVGLFIDHSDRDLIQLTKVGKVRAHQNPLLEDDALARFHLLGKGKLTT